MIASPITAAETERLEVAAAWHTRLEGGAAAIAEWEAFTQWLEADPRNRTAYDAVDSAAAEAVELLSTNREIAVATHPPRGMTRRFSTRIFLGMTGVAAAALIAVVAKPDLFMPGNPETIATSAGERRDVTLTDGSTVHLNTNTKLSVTMTAQARSVRLEQGEAMFNIARDTAHPFRVSVGDRTVRVVGTAFNVLRHKGQVTVTVEHGQVNVSDHAAGDEVPLAEGDQYTAREGARAYQVAKIDPAIVTAWRNGRVVFVNATLSEVVTNLSRYYGRPVVVQDPEVAALRFSGILKIEDQMTTVRRLEALLPITVKESRDEVRLERGTSR